MTISKLITPLFFLFYSGCSSPDSNIFQPTSFEMSAASKIRVEESIKPGQLAQCEKIGNLQIHAIVIGQSTAVVAVRKYKNATLVVHTRYGMDGGILGEAPYNFYDVYSCNNN